MEATRMTVLAAGAGVLLAAVILAPFTIVALLNHVPADPAGDDEPAVHMGGRSMPAAQEALAQGLGSEDAAYMADRMEMAMYVWGPGEVLLAEGVVRMDPESGDFMFYMVMDFKEIGAAYGLNESGLMEGDEEMLDWFDMDDGRFEMSMVQVGDMAAFSFAGQSLAWRGQPSEDGGFTLFPEEDEGGMGDPRDMQFLSTEELRRFIEADESMAVHDITESEWEGTPTWKVTTTVIEDDMEGDAVFHFRQEDMAPLAVDMVMHVPPEDGFLGIMPHEDPAADPWPLEDFELTMQMRFQYGGDIKISLPQEYERLAVTPVTHKEQTEHEIVRTLTPEHDERVPLSELEIHVVVYESPDPMEDPDAEGGVVETLAVLDLAESLETTASGYRIVYEDNDGDGHLSPGDRFFVQVEDPDLLWVDGDRRVALMVWDKWAGDYEFAPAPGVVWLVALALAAFGLGRLRRRDGA